MGGVSHVESIVVASRSKEVGFDVELTGLGLTIGQARRKGRLFRCRVACGPSGRLPGRDPFGTGLPPI